MCAVAGVELCTKCGWSVWLTPLPGAQITIHVYSIELFPLLISCLLLLSKNSVCAWVCLVAMTRVQVVQNVFHLWMMETTVHCETLNALKFSVPIPRPVPWYTPVYSYVLGLDVSSALPMMGPGIDMCAFPNNLQSTEFTKHVVETFDNQWRTMHLSSIVNNLYKLLPFV